MNFDQRLGFCLRSQSERPYSYRTPDNSVFLWSICLFTQCIRNQHFQIFLLQVKGLGVPFRMQVHVLSTWTYPCVVWTRCSHQQFDSWSQLDPAFAAFDRGWSKLVIRAWREAAKGQTQKLALERLTEGEARAKAESTRTKRRAIVTIAEGRGEPHVESDGSARRRGGRG